jgi:hypothetical protein
VIDGELLVRTLAAFERGEPRVCSSVKTPRGSPTPVDSIAARSSLSG